MKLKNELRQAKVLLEMIAKREKLRKESLVLETKVFEKRALIRQWKRQLNIAEDEPKEKVKKCFYNIEKEKIDSIQLLFL